MFNIDWNGEVYSNGYDEYKEKDTNKIYKPVYRFEIENLDIENIEENSDQYNRAFEIIGFEEN